MKIELIHRKDALEITSGGAVSSNPRRGACFSSLLSVAFALSILFSSTNELKAREREDLDVSLTARRVVRLASGGEEFSDDPVALPGDVINYTAQFHNQSAKTLGQLKPTIPVPAGMEYVPSASSAPFEASLDGHHFEPIPVRRAHVLADGRTVMVEVPVSSYRALRWNAGDLAPGATFIASARVRVTANVAQP